MILSRFNRLQLRIKRRAAYVPVVNKHGEHVKPIDDGSAIYIKNMFLGKFLIPKNTEFEIDYKWNNLIPYSAISIAFMSVANSTFNGIIAITATQ